MINIYRKGGAGKNRIWLYAGRETYLWGRGKEIGDLKSILRKGHYESTVMTFNSLKVHACMHAHMHVCMHIYNI